MMCSAYDTSDNRAVAMEIGVEDFLNKPVRKQQLSNLLNKHGVFWLFSSSLILIQNIKKTMTYETESEVKYEMI